MKDATKDVKSLIQTYERVRRVYVDTYKLLSTVRDEVRGSQYALEDMVNVIYVLRELSRLFNDIRKETDGVLHIFENVCCAMYVMLYQNSPEKSNPIRASLATGTPRLTVGVTLPKERSDPEKYYELMKYFGIPAEALKNKLIKSHWPGICEYVSQLAEEGKPLPPGINPDKTYPMYSIAIRAFQQLDDLVRMEGGDDAKHDKFLTKVITTRQRIEDQN